MVSRYTVDRSPMLREKFGEAGMHDDDMMGVIAAREYKADEIITVYMGEDIGAVDGEHDAYKGYHTMAELAKGDTM